MTETIPAPPDTFANPYLLCPECEQRVTNTRFGDGPEQNLPCGHRTQGYRDTCPSWSPVDGCRCSGGPATHRRAAELPA